MKTNCKNCCFLEQDEKGIGCSAGQYCVISGQDIYTPGYCRLKRTKEWLANAPRTLGDHNMVEIARHEIALEFDLLVIFDECLHEKADLHRTITDNEWMDDRCNKIIVCDISGRRVNNRHSLEYFEDYRGDIPLVLDYSISAENPVRSIRRMVVNCPSRYFLVLPAGKTLSNIDKLSLKIMFSDMKCVLWKFPPKYGETTLNMKGNTIFSLYYRKAFKTLTNHCKEECTEKDQPCGCEPFYNDLVSIENETNSQVFLSQTIDECVII